jgi:hypothetical protein
MKKLYVFPSSEDCSTFDLKLEITPPFVAKTLKIYDITNPTYNTGVACALVWFCS